MNAHRFAPTGMLALAPRAFGMMFTLPSPPAVQRVGDVAVVSIDGPLMNRENFLFDSYQSIKARVAEALESKPLAIVLRIDSPGGLVSGCFETSKTIRAMALAEDVPVYSYVDGAACSAAYALACASDVIALSETASVGSIGVIDAMIDATAAEAAQGVHTTIISSGARKDDGNPSVKQDGRSIAVAQERVDKLAGVFFDLVATARSLSVEDIRAFDASIAFGADAVNLGLADQVMTFDELLASIASSASPESAGNGVQMDEEEQARASLQAIVDDEDKDEKSRAKARSALAALNASDDDDKPEASSDDEDEDDEPSASASVPASAAAAVAANAGDVVRRVASLEKQLEASNRAAIFAARPDIDSKIFEGVPTPEVAKIVGRMAKPKAPKPAATAVVPATRGEGQGTAIGPNDPELAAIDRAMGLNVLQPAKAERRGNTLYLGRAPDEKA